MTHNALEDILLLLVLAVIAVTLFQRLRLPSSLGYLLVGVLIGPPVLGVIADVDAARLLAEFGIVFLLFTIGLNFSLPQVMAMKHTVFGLGTAQVLLTTVLVAIPLWFAGLSPASAFVVGAAFAQSSTTIIGKQLTDQAEEHSRHGRLAIAMSVFQDVTAVPFVVVIPVLAMGGAGSAVSGELMMVLLKAAAAFVIVFFIGRRLLRPLFHEVAARRSPELFTMTALLVSLAAAWTTHSLDLSLALGAFLAGMMLGETEFRHQVEAAIRPFRDVLLGLFFVTIGMLFDLRAFPAVWHWALAGALGLLVLKTLLVAALTRFAGVEPAVAWRTALTLAVGGEFGFALLAIALGAGAVDAATAQAALTAVLLSMMLAPLLIRHRDRLLAPLTRGGSVAAGIATEIPAGTRGLRGHVIICGYGRIGQNVAHFLEQEGIEFTALDLDPARVREARAAGERVFYGDSAQRELLEALGVEHSRLVVVSYDDTGAALKVLHHVRALRPHLPVLVRTRDESRLAQLQQAGATEVVSETLEAGMMLVSHVLLLLGLPVSRVLRRMRDVRADRYRFLREFFHGDEALFEKAEEGFHERLHSVALGEESHAAGRTLAELGLERVLVTALTRAGIRGLGPAAHTRLRAGDVVVLYGTPEDLERAEQRLQRGA
jgi:CPA2 family monovalent cation:H+ antiporter-2